jgi:hypothetical protein
MRGYLAHLSLGMHLAFKFPSCIDRCRRYIVWSVHGGRVIVVPAGAANRTVTLPDPSAGLYFKLIYGGAAEETENLIIDTGSGANCFIGGLQHLATIADNVSVYADGNSKSSLWLLMEATAH